MAEVVEYNLKISRVYLLGKVGARCDVEERHGIVREEVLSGMAKKWFEGTVVPAEEVWRMTQRTVIIDCFLYGMSIVLEKCSLLRLYPAKCG